MSGVPCEVVVSAIVDAGHVFVQQPTHPSFTSLGKLDQYMIAVYSQSNGIPALPQPIEREWRGGRRGGGEGGREGEWGLQWAWCARRRRWGAGTGR